MFYKELREYMQVLEKKGLLKRIKKEVDKNWEITAICRVAFKKITSDKRPALLFENVKGYDVPVLVGSLGASREVYATALSMDSKNLLSNIANKWSDALQNPINPKIVESGPCKENIITGKDIDILELLPVPIWTVGEDPSPYLTSPCDITRDPETKIQNVGTYRVEIKDKAKTGIYYGETRHIARHVRANEKKNQPTPIAIVIGTDPTIGLASVSSIPYGVGELGVAGGLRKKAIDVVKCESSDLLVPANAEVVIEGEIPPHYRENEGPFGEYTGYMGPPGDQPIVNVKCITYRNNPIYHAFLSQMPPSESSLIKSIGRESNIYSHLKKAHRMPIRDVHLTEASGAAGYLAISLDVQYPGQVWEAMWVAWTLDPSFGKFTVVVNDDIDVRDAFALEWALSFRVRPHEDLHILRKTAAVHLDPATAPACIPQHDHSRHMLSKIAIDATRSHEYPHIALPPKEHLQKVECKWNEYWGE